MIALGNNIYRTLDEKFYLGTQQIGKVYLGETLIYPEEKIIIGGITIDTDYRDIKGNMFDLGITADQYTDFELCMFLPPSNEFNPANDIWHIFGVYPRTSASGDANDCRSITTNSNDVNIRGNASTFSESTIANPSANFYLLNGTSTYRFGYNGADGAATSYDLNREDIGSSSDRRYFISLEGSTLRLGHKFGKFYWEQEKIRATAAGDATRVAQCNAEIAAINNSPAKAIVTRSALTTTTGHLWYNCINMFTSNPNTDRTNVSGYDDDTYNYFGYTNSTTLIYLLVIQKDSNNNILHKYLFTQSKDGETTVDRTYLPNDESEKYGKNIPILRKYEWDSTMNNGAGGFDEQQATIIYPFKYCKPYRG